MSHSPNSSAQVLLQEPSHLSLLTPECTRVARVLGAYNTYTQPHARTQARVLLTKESGCGKATLTCTLEE